MTVEILYPEICNLFGDLMNVEFLKQSGAETVKTGLKEKPKFIDGGIDMVYMGAMTEHSQELAIRALEPYVAGIKAAIESGTVFLVTGNALEIFGGTIQNEDGTEIKCLGLYDTVAKRKMMARYNAVYLGKFQNMDIVGYKSQFTHLYGGEGVPYAFETVRGDGRHPGEKGEGVRINNFFGTYLIGPLLVINPPFTKYLMELAGEQQPNLAFEAEAMDVYHKRVAEFENPKTRIIY